MCAMLTHAKPQYVFQTENPIADLQSQLLLLVDVSNGEVIASAPLTDEVLKWLSVDPLADKYPNISPLCVCSMESDQIR